MSNEHHDRLAAEHVLELLDGDDRILAESLLLTDPNFAAAVEQWRLHFAELDETAPRVAAGENLWTRIESGLAGTVEKTAQRAARPVVKPTAKLWENLAFWRMTGMAAAFASLILALGVGFFAYKANRQPVMIAVLLNDAHQPGAVLSTFADGRAEWVPLQGTSIPANHSMQLWTFPDPNGAPVSVGVINAAQTVRLNLDKLPHLQAEQLFAISMEPLHGSPTGLPTGPVVLKGTASTPL